MPVLDGLSALVTGGGSGIGLGTAKRLAADGARVTIAGRTEKRLEDAAAEIGDAQFVVADVTSEADVERAVAKACEPTGRLDVLFACAGGSRHGGPIVASDADGWRATIELNLVGTFLCFKHAGAAMVQGGGGGSMIGMSSIAGHTTHRFMSAYSASKAGIEMLVKCAADELGEHGIRVNGVQPGIVDTELMSFITAGGPVLDSYYENMPVSRVGTVDDVAAVVAFLAGPDSTWITGQMIGIDGGHQLRRGPDYGTLMGG
ncbi:MAG TPA: SDR family oxidoreductase [Acidimicrobiia bacterium]|jgi:NAD(P)-dependent dehydrogenase (short-subunit alcohol dehydrogenase family)|nr:SDR family oxidoreductase [Acidimicrobiia bacterium]